MFEPDAYHSDTEIRWATKPDKERGENYVLLTAIVKAVIWCYCWYLIG